MSIAPVFQQEFGALEAFRQLLANRLQPITRGPAKPISAFGSAITTSPRNAKLADTPPIVGSVSTEMNGSFASDSWSASRWFSPSASATAAFLHPRTARSGEADERRCSSAFCAPRTKRSPTTDPIEPPMNENSKQAATTGSVDRTAHHDHRVGFARIVHRFLQTIGYLRRIGTSACRPARFPSRSRNGLPDRAARRGAHAHRCACGDRTSGTCRFASTSLRYSTASQDGHLTHRPSECALRLFGSVCLIFGGNSLSASSSYGFLFRGRANRPFPLLCCVYRAALPAPSRRHAARQ